VAHAAFLKGGDVIELLSEVLGRRLIPGENERLSPTEYEKVGPLKYVPGTTFLGFTRPDEFSKVSQSVRFC
jgi:hypothetical protein